MPKSLWMALLPVVLVSLLIAATASADEPAVVAVGLGGAGPIAEITPLAALQVAVQDTGQRDWRIAGDIRMNPGEEWQIGPEPGGAAVQLQGPGGVQVKGTALRLTPPNAESEPAGFRLAGRDYPGVLTVSRQPQTVLFVNHVVLEVYLPGVLGGEVYAGWPAEALKAQAVVCRTNAVAWASRHGEAFDLCDGSHCQVYRGITTDARLTGAVNATAGEMLRYNGRLIVAYFHAASGGQTENNDDIWPGGEKNPARALPYLRSVADYDQESPYYRWNTPRYYTVNEFARLLKVEGEGGLTIEPLKGPNNTIVRYRFSRPGGAARTLVREDIRSSLGLPSPRLTFYVVTPEDVAAALKSLKLEGPIVLNEITRGEAGYDLDVRMKISVFGQAVEETVTVAAGSFVVVDGRGFGHGVGMSQWGARAMAANGSPYQEILLHYYQGVEIAKLY